MPRFPTDVTPAPSAESGAIGEVLLGSVWPRFPYGYPSVFVRSRRGITEVLPEGDRRNTERDECDDALSGQTTR